MRTLITALFLLPLAACEEPAEPERMPPAVQVEAATTEALPDRILTKTDPPVTILTYQALFVGFLMIIPAIMTWQDPTLGQWGLLVLIGIVSWAAQLSNIQAFRAGEATAIASLDYSRLIYATIIGVIVFSQWPSVETLVGAAIIIAASLYTVRREAIRGRQLARTAEGRGYNN